MFRDLCEQRKNLRRNLYAELGSPSEVKATSLLELRTGLSERASIIASNLKSRSKHRLTLNADHRSSIYETGLADAERVRSEATKEVERYTRAEHLLHDPALLRLGDIDRERRIYAEAAAIIHDVGLMSDLDEEVASQVLKDIPPRPPGQLAQAAASSAYIALREEEAKRYKIVNQARDAVKLANRSAMDAASDVRDLIKQINASPGATDAIPVAKRTEARNRLLMLRKTAEAKLKVSEEKEKELRCILTQDCGHKGTTEQSWEDDTQPASPLKAWIVGLPVVLNSSRAVGLFPTSTWCFGYTSVPLTGGVVYHGSFATGAPLHKGLWADLGGGTTKITDSQPEFLIIAGGGAYASALDAKTGATHNSYTVSGSATRAVNGKFNRTGFFGGAPCFTNENDLLLFRANLQETPELAITTQDLRGHAHIGAAADTGAPNFIDSDPNDKDFHFLAKLGQRLALLDDLERIQIREKLSSRQENEQVAHQMQRIWSLDLNN